MILGWEALLAMFKTEQPLLKCPIQVLPFSPMMNVSMAVWTNCSNPSGMIRPTLGNEMCVVRFKIRRSIYSQKRSLLATGFTDSIRSRENISSNIRTALVVSPFTIS